MLALAEIPRFKADMNPVIRSAFWLAFFAAVILSWLAMYWMAVRMGISVLGKQAGMMNMAGMPAMGSPAMLVPMWAVMMIAMMGPTFVHTASTYEALMKSANGTCGGWVGLVLGFFAVWAGFAVVIALAQAWLMRVGWLDMFGVSTTLWVTVALLIIVGSFQFTRVKEVCQGVCQAPINYFLGHWRPGGSGGFRMGMGLGTFCVGCCWGYMVLGFAGGVMNLLWMGLATVIMVLEKLPPVAHYVSKPVGVVLIVTGLAIAVRATGFV